MQSDTIDILSSLLPGEGNTPALVGASSLPQATQDKAMRRFYNVYRNVAFGWKAATTLAHSGQPFPLAMFGRDLWVWRAYLHVADPAKWYDPDIEIASALNNHMGKHDADIVRAMLVLPDTTFHDIAEATGLDINIIEAFETLFYNVKDRVKDTLYISQVVYPQYKLVELQEDYAKNTDMGNLIIRAGFSSEDIEQVKYAAGMTSNNFLSKMAADPGNEKMLDNHLIANATFLSHMNLTNQRMPGLTQARQLMVAKQANGVTDTSTGISSHGTTMQTDWSQASTQFRTARNELMMEHESVDLKDIQKKETAS